MVFCCSSHLERTMSQNPLLKTESRTLSSALSYCSTRDRVSKPCSRLSQQAIVALLCSSAQSHEGVFQHLAPWVSRSITRRAKCYIAGPFLYVNSKYITTNTTSTYLITPNPYSTPPPTTPTITSNPSPRLSFQPLIQQPCPYLSSPHWFYS